MLNPAQWEDLKIQLGVFIEAVAEAEPLPLNWSDNFEDQARSIRMLAFTVAEPDLLVDVRRRAYDMLQAIAKYYLDRRIHGASIPRVLYAYSLHVTAGEIKQPSKGRGRRGKYSVSGRRRNHAILIGVTMCTLLGKTYEKAVELVSDATDISIERIDSIVSDTAVDRANGKYLSEATTRRLHARLQSLISEVD